MKKEQEREALRGDFAIELDRLRAVTETIILQPIDELFDGMTTAQIKKMIMRVHYVNELLIRVVSEHNPAGLGVMLDPKTGRWVRIEATRKRLSKKA